MDARPASGSTGRHPGGGSRAVSSSHHTSAHVCPFACVGVFVSSESSPSESRLKCARWSRRSRVAIVARPPRAPTASDEGRTRSQSFAKTFLLDRHPTRESSLPRAPRKTRLAGHVASRRRPRGQRREGRHPREHPATGRRLQPQRSQRGTRGPQPMGPYLKSQKIPKSQTNDPFRPRIVPASSPHHPRIIPASSPLTRRLTRHQRITHRARPGTR